MAMAIAMAMAMARREYFVFWEVVFSTHLKF
jgi:hypothetical protein